MLRSPRSALVVALFTGLLALLLPGCTKPEPVANRAESEALAEAGLAAATKGDVDAAIAKFGDAIAKDDANHHAWFGRAALALRKGDLAAAQRDFEKYLTLAPRDPAAEAGLGIVFARIGKLEEAERRLSVAKDIANEDASLRDLFERVTTGKKVEDSTLPAIEARFAWIERAARKREIARLQIRGLALVRDDTRYRDAEGVYEAAVRLDPEDATSQLGLGATALRGSQNLPRAEAALKKFEQLEPDSPAGNFCFAVLYNLQDESRNFDLVIDRLKRVEKAIPADQNTVYYLACALRLKEGDANMNSGGQDADFGSFAKFQRSAELNEFCPSTHKRLAQSLRIRGEDAEADRHDAMLRELTSEENKKRFPEKNSGNAWSRIIDQRLERIDYTAAGFVASEVPVHVEFVAQPPLIGSAATALAAADLDSDCDLDLIAAGVGIFRNDAGSYSLVEGSPSLVAAAGDRAFREVHPTDFDNDGHLDLLLVGAERLALLHGNGALAFTDITASVGLSELAAGSAVAFDYDHEGDVDILLLVADGANRTTRMMRNDLPPRLPQASANAPTQKSDLHFTDVTKDSEILATGEGLVAAFGDIENGNDTDLVVLGASGAGHHFTNRRNGKFRDIGKVTGVDKLNGRAIELADLDSDGWLDLIALGADGRPYLARNRGDGTFDPPVALPLPIAANTFTLADLDNDGAQDVVFATKEGVHVVRNANGKFEEVSGRYALGPGKSPSRWIVAYDRDTDGDDDLIAGPEDAAPALLRNDGGNANRRVTLWLKGDLSNREGVGAKVEISDVGLYAKREVRTLPVTIGVGKREKIGSCFVLWTNGVRQPYRDCSVVDTEWMKSDDWKRMDPDYDIEPRCGGWLILQIVRMEGSCPLLYACDGERFHYITDALCCAVLGLDVGGRLRAIPNPEDAVWIPGNMLRPKDGRLKLAFTEELREITYLDWVELIAVDHRKGTEVRTDNKFTMPPFPPFTIHRSSALNPIRKAIDSHGNDVTERVAEVDRKYVDSFAKCLPPMQGMAEMHTLELDLGDLGDAKSVRLFLEGWFNWTNSSVNSALAQRGTWQFTPPLLDVADGKGGWISRGVAGIPAGDNKTVIADLSGAFPSQDHRVRLTSNLQVYWDRIRVATDADDSEGNSIVTHALRPTLADLHYRGYSKQVLPDGHEPNSYDYHSVDTDGSTYGTYYARFAGRLTRFGDVSPLLDTVDDQFVIIHHGDELSLEFDPATLPPLADGMERTYVFRSFGWAKDMDHNTGAATTVEPLPFRGMSSYPPQDGESYPLTEANRRYLEDWNTRISKPEPMLVRSKASRSKLPAEANGTHFSFTDITSEAGIDFLHADGRVLINLEDTIGAGAAWGDYDGDGDDDLFLVGGRGPGDPAIDAAHHHVLYRNEGDGTFTDVTFEAGVGGHGSGMAALFADLDNDGDSDLFVTQIGNNLLYRNDSGRFTDITASSGVAGEGYHSGIAAGDYDRDGDLDLYVGRYVTLDPNNRPQEAPGFGRGFVRDDPPSVLPMAYPPAAKTLWRNDGGLRFSDVTAQAGVADEMGKTLGVLFADFDLDGWLDLFCANDVTPNNFFRNKGDGTFEALAFDVGLDDPRGGMGVALADVDDDTDLDLAVTYWQLEPNGLYRNNVIRAEQKRTRIPTFEDISTKVGFAAPSVGKVKWGISLSDLDNDMRLDALIANGYTSPDYETTTFCLPQPPLLMQGIEGGRFRDITSTDYGSFFGGVYNGRGVAASDYDHDGDLDFIVTQNNGRAHLLRNDGGSQRNWLEVGLVGNGKANPLDPAGARVIVRTGERKQTRVLLLGSSYLCGDTRFLHFGLDQHDKVDGITVHWPNGRVTEHPGTAARQRITIQEPADD